MATLEQMKALLAATSNPAEEKRWQAEEYAFQVWCALLNLPCEEGYEQHAPWYDDTDRTITMTQEHLVDAIMLLL